MKYSKYIICSFLLSLIACSKDALEPEESQLPADERMMVCFTSRTGSPNQENLLQAGLYMVNYVNEQPDEFLESYNYVNNLQLTWTENGWTTETPIYWKDMETRADFYVYAPYQSSVTDARHMEFSIIKEQSTAAAYAQSDLQWGKVAGQSPTDGGFELTLRHLLSQMIVTVTAGDDFGEELLASDVQVVFGGSKTNGIVDLATGAITVNGEANDVTLMSNGDLTYKGVLLPQQIALSSIMVVWRGAIYTINKSYKLETGRQYIITLKLNQAKSGINVGIVGWDVIDEDFGGTAS